MVINIKDFIVRSIFGYYHLWFIFVLIGLYLITPVLSKIAESNYSAVYFIIVFLLFNSFLISIPKVSVFSSMIEYLNQYKILIAGGYSGYFMLGYFLRNGINKKAEIAVAIAGVVSYFLVVSLSFVHLSFDWDYASYLSLPIVFLSCSVFCFFTKAESKIESKMMLKKLISFYQPLTLYIYFIHIIATDAIRKYDYLTRRNNLITVAIYTVLIILLCSLISWMFVKIKSLFFKKCVPVLLPGRRDRI